MRKTTFYSKQLQTRRTPIPGSTVFKAGQNTDMWISHSSSKETETNFERSRDRHLELSTWITASIQQVPSTSTVKVASISPLFCKLKLEEVVKPLHWLQLPFQRSMATRSNKIDESWAECLQERHKPPKTSHNIHLQEAEGKYNVTVEDKRPKPGGSICLHASLK